MLASFVSSWNSIVLIKPKEAFKKMQATDEEELAEAKLLVERLSRSERDVKSEIDSCAKWIILLLAQESDAKEEAERENRELQELVDGLKEEVKGLKKSKQKKEDAIASNQKMARKHVETLKLLKKDLDDKTSELHRVSSKLKDVSKKHKALVKENLATIHGEEQRIQMKGKAPTPPATSTAPPAQTPQSVTTPRSGRPSMDRSGRRN